jgi:lysophospholipase L1-like esterase
VVIALLLAALLVGVLALAPGAGAAAAGPHKGKHPGKAPKPKQLPPPAKVKVGRVTLGTTPAGKPALLVAIRYPIQAAGRGMSATVLTRIPGAPTISSRVYAPVSAGALRKPERRRAFTFVHEIGLRPTLATALAKAESEGKRPKVTVKAGGAIDVDGDGQPDLTSSDSATRLLAPLLTLEPPIGGKAGGPFCGTVPQIRLRPGQSTRVPLPACDQAVQWKVQRQPASGTARIAGDELVIAAGRKPGSLAVPLNLGPPVQVTVAPPKQVSVRAIGDSVTAGFGYYSNGSLMSILRLYECKPGGKFLNDACSSNSTSTFDTEKEEPVPYAPDYGLANNVSWAAQWANEYGVTNYKNLAVSGSEPVNWAPEGSLYKTTKEVEAENPDYILMTVGANPILSETLFGADPMGCALYADIFGNYSECVEAAFAKVNLRGELRSLYSDLVAKTDSTIYLMQYHLSIPSSALLYTSTQIAEVGALMNKTIAEVAAEVNPKRLQVVTPPQFNTGLNLEPVVPAGYECGYYLTDHVDGPSVQSTITQYQLHLFHPLEFCPQKKGEEPWVISGDTGIHPSAEGYFHMASRVPAPS